MAEVRRNVRNETLKLWRGALVERRKAHKGLLAGMHVIDIFGWKPRFDLQFIRLGHNLHRDFARGDHAANGVDGKLMNNSAGGNAQIDPLEQILRCHAFLDQLGFFVLRLA